MSNTPELEQLKAEATALGIEFSGNISAATLRKRIEDFKAGQAQTTNTQTETANTQAAETVITSTVATQNFDPAVLATPTPTPVVAPAVAVSTVKAESPVLSARDEAMKLIRVRVVPMDRTKRDYVGELFSAGNAVVPTVKRLVPFNVITHIENILYQQIKDKDYQYFTSKKVNGVESREAKIGKAYAIEVLPPLTEEELAELERSQLARNVIE